MGQCTLVEGKTKSLAITSISSRVAITVLVDPLLCRNWTITSPILTSTSKFGTPVLARHSFYLLTHLIPSNMASSPKFPDTVMQKYQDPTPSHCYLDQSLLMLLIEFAVYIKLTVYPGVNTHRSSRISL